MENYIKEDIIGEGAFGTVYKVKCRVTGNVFALKYHVRGVEDSTVRELSCLASLSGHPHIIRMCDCFVDDGTLAMLMPYVPYKLSELIHNEQAEASHFRQDRPPQSLPLSFVAHFSSQVASALSYMHRLSIVHRDLTPFNVLLTEGLTVKVADMGLSRQISKWMSLNVVTVAYRAPELFGVGDFGDYTCSIDMWSLGVMIADAMERRMVFRGYDKTTHFQHRDGTIHQTGNETVSTHQLIVQSLCPRNHPSAQIQPCNPMTTMPTAMGCDVVRRIVLKLLTFHETKRLPAHELLQDREWMTLASCMTEEDMNVVRNQVER